MPDERKLNKPWLVAVWPGMGQVTVNAGYSLMAKLGFHLVAEFSPRIGPRHRSVSVRREDR